MSQYFTYQDQQVSVGDTVAVTQEIVEGSKKRLQVFEGIVIATGGMTSGKTFTVRKIGTNNIGVEKIFPLNLPSIKDIKIKRRGDVRRAKLYFLRHKIGRAASKVKEKGVGSQKQAA